MLDFLVGGGDRRWEAEGLTAAADEGPVFVVGFVPDSLRSGLGRDKLHFAYQAAAPSLIDATAEFALHGFQLALPGFAVGRQLEAIADKANRPGVSGKPGSDDRRPRAGEPGESRVRLLEPIDDASEDFSGTFHEAANSSMTRLWKCARLHRRFARAKIAKYSSTMPRHHLKASSQRSRYGDIV